MELNLEELDMIFDSSSSEDEEMPQVDILLYRGCRCNIRVIPRINDFIERVVDVYNAQDFQEAFRYSKLYNIIQFSQVISDTTPLLLQDEQSNL